MHDKRTGRNLSQRTPLASKKRFSGGTPVWLTVIVTVLLLVTAGVAYRAAASRLQGNSPGQVTLPIPLKEVPARVEGWVGEDLEIPSTTKIYMQRNFADDHVSRRYVNAARGVWADLYVVYCSSKPAGIIGHQPRVCYPNNGWIHDSTETSQITSCSGRPISCLVHRFHKPAPSYQEIVVLNFYVLNGQITLSEDEFSGFLGRAPNLAGDPAHYVAQVQVSSIFEYAARTAAADMADIILAFLPDQQGHVTATDLGGGIHAVGPGRRR
jgi:hypothetical protein